MAELMANVAQFVVGRGQDLWGLAGQALLESFHYQQSAKFRLFSYSAILAALAGKGLTAAAASALPGPSTTCTAVFSSTSSSFSASPSSQFHFCSPATFPFPSPLFVFPMQTTALDVLNEVETSAV